MMWVRLELLRGFHGLSEKLTMSGKDKLQEI